MNRRAWARSMCLGALGAGPAWLGSARAGGLGDGTMTITLIGDSTVARWPSEHCAMMGWGRKLAEVAPPGITVRNRAWPGRSSSEFLAREWPAVRASLPRGGIVLMQFGHVDAIRGASPEASYRPSLQRLAEEALARGARPWLCTPVASWRFAGASWVYEFERFADQMQALARVMQLPLLPLGQLMGAEIERLGPQRAQALFMLAHDGQDRIHLTAAGATLAAGLVWRALQTARR